METSGDGGFRMLIEALQEATSQNPQVMKNGEGKLATWETQQGFFPALANVIENFNLDSNVRFMAAVYLKNGVDKHWRKTQLSKPVITDDDKAQIRDIMQRIVLIEPVLSIATQLSVIVGKIGRMEVPREWSTLLPILLENIRSVELEKQHRALMTTYRVVKILSTKRLTGDRKIFQDVAGEIFGYLHQLWDSLFLTWAHSGDTGDALTRAHFALKILRILTIRGYINPHESSNVLRFIPNVIQRAKETLLLRASRRDNSPLLEKHIIVMWKIIGDLLETHPLSFVPFLQGALEFATYFGFSDGRAMAFQRVSIHSLNLIKGILLCPEFRAPERTSNEDINGSTLPSSRTSFRDTTPEADPLTYQAANIKIAYFTDEVLTGLIQVLATQYLPLSQAELESWNEDPEEFALRTEDAGEAWKYNLRQCSETLFVTIFKEFRKSVEIFLSLMQMYEQPIQNPNDHSSVLAKDALYNAAGIVAYELYDEFSFDTWLNTTLVQELALPIPILHRRITWLIGQWTGVKITPESRPQMFALLLSGLRSDDVVVRLTSSQSLRRLLDDFDFVPEQLEPYLNQIFYCLLTLLKDVQECDNKMRVLCTLSVLIERMASHIKTLDQIPALHQYLPVLWESNHNMLKAAVVSTSFQLVLAIGTESSCLRSFLLPVIQLATDLNRPEHVYLLEDGLELWAAMMDYIPDPPDHGFISLVENLIPLLGISTEHLKMSLNLVNSYALIYSDYFVERFGTIICQELNSTISDMRTEGVLLILRCVETMMRTSHTHGPNAMKPILRKVFKSAYDALDTPVLLAHFLSVISRLLLIGEPVFQQGLNECSLITDSRTTPLMILDRLTEVMCSKVSVISQTERKKLVCLALLKLMSTGEQIILNRLCGIFLALGECLNDVTKTDVNGRVFDSLCMLDTKTPKSQENLSGLSPQVTLDEGETGLTENDIRRRKLRSVDLVYSVDLYQIFRQEVGNLRGNIGEQLFNDYLSTVDVETMAMVKPYLE